MTATWTKNATDQLRDSLRTIGAKAGRRIMTRRTICGTALQARLEGSGDTSDLRIARLDAPLAGCAIGTATIYEQTGTDCPPTAIVPPQMVTVLNNADFLLGTESLMYVQRVSNFDQLLVFPAQIEECQLESTINY